MTRILSNLNVLMVVAARVHAHRSPVKRLLHYLVEM